jgi:diguanylate cyclase (GGDEF)-like protein
MARLRPRAGRGQLVVALWLLLLALLTLALAVWVAGEIAGRHERENLDAGLAGSLRAARSELGGVLMDARLRAEGLARSPSVQRALERRDAEAALRIADREPGIALYAGGRLLAGSSDAPARRTVEVVGRDGRPLGRVVITVPLGSDLAARLARNAGLTGEDAVAIAEGTRIVSASTGVEGSIPQDPSGSVELEGGRGDYRYASAPLLSGTRLRLVALGSAGPVDDAVGTARRRALAAAIVTVALLALLAWTAAQILRRRGPSPFPPEPEGERRRQGRPGRDAQRVREAVGLVGDALAATHDPEALLPVILQSAIEATGAAGARLVAGTREVARAGDPGSGGRPLKLELSTDEDGGGRLLLYPPADGTFDRDGVQLAQWLAAQASIALENERLHRTVKRQAITDELTQLANRRRFTETLSLEVRRAERFGDPLTLVLADIDDFKQINDRYGHQVGDEVLRRFADVLRENMRDFDLPVRFGGEEFAVLLPGTDLDGGEQLARRLAAALARLRMPEIGGDRPPVTASFGVASFPEAAGASELLTAADRALYQAKAEGKDRVVRAVSASGRRD